MEVIMEYPYCQGQGKPLLAVYDQNVDTGVWRANFELFKRPETIVRTAIVGQKQRFK